MTIYNKVGKATTDSFENILQTTFDPSENTAILPISKDVSWDSLGDTLSVTGVENGMINLTPFFWQLQALVHRVCKPLGIPAIEMSPGNLPLVSELIRQTQASGVVSTPEIMSGLCEMLEQEKLSHHVRCKVTIEPAENIQTNLSLFKDKNIFREVHLFPGVPLLFQSLLLSTDHCSFFHINTNFVWEINEDATFITSTNNRVISLSRYKLPFILKPVETAARVQAYEIAS